MESLQNSQKLPNSAKLERKWWGGGQKKKKVSPCALFVKWPELINETGGDCAKKNAEIFGIALSIMGEWCPSPLVLAMPLIVGGKQADRVITVCQFAETYFY